MAWSGSAMFRAYAADCALPAPHVRQSWAGAAGRFKLALFDAQPTPDRTAGRNETLYGTGEWMLPREITSNPLWPAGGIMADLHTGADQGDAPTTGLGFLCLMRAGPVAVGPVTMTGVCGDFLYDAASIAQGQGIAFHDFGGALDVNLGTLTISWPMTPPYVCGFTC